ncbi:MAG: hypothetical protein JOZ15_08160 [Acidobacteria bacterium]|nr:hypothetical protein [Acidobacteriota bacterium]
MSSPQPAATGTRRTPEAAGSLDIDLTIIERELAAFDPALMRRPRLLVGSKLDAALPERLAELPRAAAARGLDWLAISSATRQGLAELVATLGGRLRAAAVEAPE